MSEVKRFDCTNGRAQHCYGCYQMTEAAEGYYVSWDDFDAQRLRADTAEAERDALRYKAELYDEVWADATGRGYANVTMALCALAAAEQRIVELSAELEVEKINAAHWKATIAGEGQISKEARRYRGIRDVLTVSELSEVTAECQNSDEWDSAVDAALNPNPEAESHEAFNDPLYNAESDARNAASLLEEVLEWFDDGVGRSPEEFKLMRKIGSWLGRSVPNTDYGSDECAHSYANKIGCPECGELMQKSCSCPGCEKPRKGGSLFCSPHQRPDGRLHFIAKTPSPTNEQLAYMMQRDGEQQ